MTEELYVLTLGAFTRWLRGEPLSVPDLERMIYAFQQQPITLSQPDDSQLSALKQRMAEVMRSGFGGGQRK